MNKKISFLLFNIWIFAVLNPIIHYFFPLTSFYQLLSPLLSLCFIVFYPLVLFLHFINWGSLLDSSLLSVLFLEKFSYDYETSHSFFIFYVLISFLSIKNKRAFYFLNVLLLFYNIRLFVFV